MFKHSVCITICIAKADQIEKCISANAEAIKRLDEELMKRMEIEIKEVSAKKKETKVPQDVIEEETGDKTKVIKLRKRCRYYNRCFCKYRSKCRFAHPNKICKSYSGTGKCGQEGCIDRHPKQCKRGSSGEGCKRKQECEYLHNDNGEKLKCKCESCKYSWQDKTWLVEHMIGNMKVFF